MKKKNSFFTLLFSCYPGGGHMYLGFMKQGVQLMLLFTVIGAVSSFNSIFRSLSFFIPILVAYSIFDAMNKRHSMEEPNDSDLELFKWFNLKNTGTVKAMNYYKVGVYVLIIAGVYILVDNVGISLLRGLFNMKLSGDQMKYFHMIERAIKSSILGILFIIGGIKLHKNLNKASQETPPHQDPKATILLPEKTN